jgi:hypothetical protein
VSNLGGEEQVLTVLHTVPQPVCEHMADVRLAAILVRGVDHPVALLEGDLRQPVRPLWPVAGVKAGDRQPERSKHAGKSAHARYGREPVHAYG